MNTHSIISLRRSPTVMNTLVRRLAVAFLPAARLPALAALSLVMAGGCAMAAEPAQPIGWHPAMVARTASMPVACIDPNTFIIGHPASPTVRGGHANLEHPAVIVARRAATPGIDANTFIVQPPVAVTWTTQPAVDDGTRLAALQR